MLRADGYVKVLDFGMARVRTTPNATTTPPRDEARYAGGRDARHTLLHVAGASAWRYRPASGRLRARASCSTRWLAGRRPSLRRTAGVLAAIMSEEPVPLSRLMWRCHRASTRSCRRCWTRPSAPIRHDVEEALAALPATRGGSSRAPARFPAQHCRTETERYDARRAYARASEGRNLVRHGEPGIGKTSLLEEFLAELDGGRRATDRARGRCSERLAGSEAYLPMLEALDSCCGTRRRRRCDGDAKPSRRRGSCRSRTKSEPSVDREHAQDLATASQERMKREMARSSRTCRARVPGADPRRLALGGVSTIDILNYVARRFAHARARARDYRPSEMALARHPFRDQRRAAGGAVEEVALGFLERLDVERYWRSSSRNIVSLLSSRRPPRQNRGQSAVHGRLVSCLHDTGSIAEENGAGF